MIQEKKSLPETIESGEINLKDFKYGDKYITANRKKIELWRIWSNPDIKELDKDKKEYGLEKFFVCGDYIKKPGGVGGRWLIWNEEGKCVHFDKKNIQYDPSLDLIEKIEKKRQK